MQIQAQPKQNQPFIELAINRGERPDWEKRINYPKLFNWFVGESGYVYTDPGLESFSPDIPDDNTRAIWYSDYKGGRYFAVTTSQILEISLDGQSFNVIADIQNSGSAVQIDENEQHQVGIVDGRKMYVYAQEADPPTFTILSSGQGFELTSPISFCVLNNIGIVLDRSTNTWIISSPNNLLDWPALDFVAQLDSTLTQGVSLETLSNNLFIFGTTGIERWVPNTGNNPYIFPFDKDTSYRQDFGAISTNGVIRGFNEIFFLSSKFVPMSLSVSGLQELAEPDYRAGLAKIISNYPDVDKCEASFYSFKGNYIFTMTFQESGVCWRYCLNSKTYSRGDDLIISALRSYQVVATPDGIFNLVELPQEDKQRTIILDSIRQYKGQQPSRNSLLGFDVQIIQGLLHNDEEQLELSFSLDGQQTWTNIVNRPIGATGERNAQTTWKMNITGKEFTPRISYYGSLPITIKQIFAIIR
jgi:hypothetical protein